MDFRPGEKENFRNPKSPGNKESSEDRGDSGNRN